MKRNGINNVLPGRNTAAIRTATRCVYLPVVARRSTWSDYVTSCAGRWLVSSSRQSDVISAGSSWRTGVNHRRRLAQGSGGDCLKRKKTPHRTPPVRSWTRRMISNLFLCRKLHLFLRKSTKTASTRAALFDSNMHQNVTLYRVRSKLKVQNSNTIQGLSRTQSAFFKHQNYRQKAISWTRTFKI